MSATVFVLGSFVVDCAYRAPRLPVAGETIIGASFTLGPGGKGSNQAVAAARAGAKVNFLTAIGKDAFAEIGRKLWAEEGIDASQAKVTEEATGSAAILLEQSTGENAIIVVPGACDRLEPEDIDGAAEVIRRSKVFLAQLEVPLEAVARGLRIARAAGLITILNPAPAPLEPLPSKLLALVDFLIPNETEAAQLVGTANVPTNEPEKKVEALLGFGAGAVILTLGARGAILRVRDQSSLRIQPFKAGPVLDTAGAGDAFCGAFATALAEGWTASDAAQFASTAAGISVTRHGTALSMAYREEMFRALRGRPAQANN